MSDENFLVLREDSLSYQESEENSQERELNFWTEAQAIFSTSWPISFYIVVMFIQLGTDFAILGHKSTDYLAAATLADSYTQIFMVIARASFNPLQTLVSQARGAGNPKLCSIWYQLCCQFGAALIGPLFVLYFFSATLLKLIHQDPAIADLTQEFTRHLCIGVPPVIYFGLTRNYMAGLKIVKPAAFVQLVSIFINFGLAYYFVFHLFGFVGGALATSFTRWITIINYVLYIFFYQKYHEETWTPWNCKNYTKKRWKALLKLLVPNVISMCLETWSYQIIAFFAGSMGEAEISVMNFSVVLFLIFHSISIGISMGCNVRVSEALGAGNLSAAKFTFRVSMYICSVFGLTAGCLWYFGRHILAKIASNDIEVQTKFVQISPPCALGLVFLCFLTVGAGTCLGQGRLGVLAIIMLTCIWGINLPLSYVFGFTLNLGVQGLWFALVCGYCVATVALGITISCSDWEECSRRARERSEVVKNKSEEVDEEVEQIHASEPMLQHDALARSHNQSPQGHAIFDSPTGSHASIN